MQDQLQKEYERSFIDGMQKQMQSSVDKAVNKMAQSGEEMVPLKAYKELSALCTRQGIRLMEYEAQSEQKPVAWIYNAGTENRITFIDPSPIREDATPLYAVPPQRPLKKLTDEEIEDACWTEVDQRLRSFARAIEQALKEKNT